MIFVRWHRPSQALTAKHVLYPQLTATSRIYIIAENYIKNGAKTAKVAATVGPFAVMLICNITLIY